MGASLLAPAKSIYYVYIVSQPCAHYGLKVLTCSIRWRVLIPGIQKYLSKDNDKTLVDTLFHVEYNTVKRKEPISYTVVRGHWQHIFIESKPIFV